MSMGAAGDMAGWLAQLLIGINTFLAVLVVIALSNRRSWRRLAAGPGARTGPHVSVLVPARDEAHQIGACIRSLLAQDYAPFDVIALDDGSTDGTRAILDGIAAGDSRLRVMAGRPLPTGWLGKNWACRQLAQAAGGDVGGVGDVADDGARLLLFVDADTRHDPRALGDAVAALVALEADLVSVLPEQEMRSWGERLLVPILPWSLFSCFPAAIAARLRWPPLVMAVGQVMLFRRAAYDRIGGHEPVRTHVAEDVALAQRLTAAGGRARLVDGTGRVQCRMYTGFRPAWEGLGRSLFDAFGRNPWLFVPIWVWMGVVFLVPPVVVALWLAGALAGVIATATSTATSTGAATSAATVTSAPILALAAMGFAILSWAIVVRRFRMPIVFVLVYPAIMAAAVAVAAYSLALGLRGGATWKGRPVSVAR